MMTFEAELPVIFEKSKSLSVLEANHTLMVVVEFQSGPVHKSMTEYKMLHRNN